VFDLSQLLAYRAGEYNPSELLEKIDDSDIRVGSRYIYINYFLSAIRISKGIGEGHDQEESC
jgi:hypothetical protein